MPCIRPASSRTGSRSAPRSWRRHPIGHPAGPGISLGPLAPTVTGDAVEYSRVSLHIDRARRVATLTVKAPDAPQPATPEEILQAGDAFWPLRAFRELDAALLHLRIDEPLIGTVVVRTDGDAAARPGRRPDAARARGSLARSRDRALHEAHAEAHGPDRAQLLRAHRAGQLLCRFALRAGARRRPVVHARRSRASQRDRAVGDEWRAAEG